MATIEKSLRRVWVNAGVPVDGTTYANEAEPGDLLVDNSNKKLYQNTNTLASPTWTEKAASGAAIGVVGDMAAAGTGTANAAGVGTTAAAIDHVHALGAHDHSGATTGGALGDHTSGAITLTESTAPAGTSCYIVRDNDGDVYVNAIAGKVIALKIAGTTVATIAAAAVTFAQAVTVSTGGIAVTGNSSVTGDLAVTGSLTFGGNWTVAATLTVDELVLDTDGVAPAGTNCYAVRDNGGDFTVNAVTGKQFIVAINNTDEYTFSATILDFNDNAADNVGFIVLNAASAPAGTEVYLVNDNTGDLTLNALNTKSIHLAINGTDEYDFSATAAAFGANNLTFSTGYISFSGAGYISLGASGYIIGTGTVASAGIFRVANNTYAISARNAADGGDVDVVKVNGSDLIEFGAALAAFSLGGTVTGSDKAITFTTGYIQFQTGSNPAGAGNIRVANNTAVWTARNAGNDGNISGWKVNASDDYEAAADVNLAGNTLYGATAADGNLILSSTLNATKGFVGIASGEEGFRIGGSATRATVGTNALHLYPGIAPSGALNNCVSIYAEGADAATELKAMDAAGNVTVLSPHTADGDYVIHSYSAPKDETVTIHLEKLIKALVNGNKELSKYVEVIQGEAKRPVWSN